MGVADVGSDDALPEIERVKIYPSITALLSGDMLRRVEVYLRAEDVETRPAENDDNNEADGKNGEQGVNP